MSVQAIERVRQIMESHTAVQLAPLVEQHDAIEQVIRWMDDEQSREAYKRELAFVGLRRCFNDKAAVQFASGISLSTWAQAFKVMKEYIKNAAIPELEDSSSDDSCINSMVTTFILKQYIYPPHVHVLQGDVMLDCGACFGDTALWAAMSGAKSVHSFEPSPTVFPVLQRNIAAHGPKISTEHEFIAVNQGVADAEGSLTFADMEKTPSSSCLHPQGNITVPVTTIDLYCAHAGVIPSFIKMDIEGAEVLALQGAKRTIAERKPRLAICLYHALSHMWEIPTLIKSIRPDYKLFCRKNAPIAEFILYAV